MPSKAQSVAHVLLKHWTRLDDDHYQVPHEVLCTTSSIGVPLRFPPLAGKCPKDKGGAKRMKALPS